MSSLHMLYSYIAYLCNLSFFCLLIQPVRGTPSPLPAVSKTGKSALVFLSYIRTFHQTAPQSFQLDMQLQYCDSYFLPSMNIFPIVLQHPPWQNNM